MQKVIDQITDHLVSLVKSEKPTYNPNELLKAGIPSFVVERIRLFLEDKVKEEVSFTEPIWFDGDARLVSDALQDFIQSAISNSFIPKAELYSVINSVVNDIIYLFIEPRKKMAEYIYRDDEELNFKELEIRCNRLTIYKHFGTAIPLYMKKRDLQMLTKERCKLLIHKLDSKLVASYTPEDWAQKLEQLFILFGGKVDPMLLVTFFEDKGLYGMAGRFEEFSEPMSKSDFIEIISKEGLVDFAPEDKESSNTEQGDEDSEKTLTDSFLETTIQSGEEEEQESTLADQYSDGSLSDEEMSELLSDIASDGVIELDEYEHVDSLNKLFSLSTEEEESESSETAEEIAEKIKEQKGDNPEEIVEFRENLISILDQAKSSFENITHHDGDETEKEIFVDDDLSNVFQEESEPEPSEAETVENSFVENSETVEESEEKPIWAQFISEDQMDVMMGGKRNKNQDADTVEGLIGDDAEEEIEVEDSYMEEPILEEDSEIGPEIKEENEIQIQDLLNDREIEFIEVIFSGSESKYQKAIKKIEQFGSWKETSNFIQKDIFAKNNVDMFSGATVDFTDRLHRYFNELSNK